LTYSLVGSLALDLLFAINSKVVKEIPKVTHWARADISENILEYGLGYAIPEMPAPFCDLRISVPQHGSSELFVDVCADYEYSFIEDRDVCKTLVDNLMSEHIDLKPIITKESVKRFDTDKNGKTNFDKPITKPSFKIRYMVLHYSIMEKEDICNSYDFDKMANDVFPYIKSLYGISKIIHPNSENLKGDVN